MDYSPTHALSTLSSTVSIEDRVMRQTDGNEGMGGVLGLCQRFL